ncbi:MAG: hypothetical protein HQK94_18630, partial [Nitrospirae bacterium]|nr:hypothetical protein [Nitrospirota bacterium]
MEIKEGRRSVYIFMTVMLTLSRLAISRYVSFWTNPLKKLMYYGRCSFSINDSVKSIALPACFNNSISYKAIINTIMTLLIAVLLPSLSFAGTRAPETYTLKARLALKTEKHIVTESLPFHWTLDMAALANSGGGWIEKGGGLVWVPGGKNPLINMPLEISNPDGVNISRSMFPGDFNELWIEYKDINPQNPCNMGVVLYLNPKTELTRNGDVGQVNYNTAIGGSSVPMHLESIDVAGSAWKEKDVIHDFASEYGLSFGDEDWYYTQDDKLSVIKKRFHKNISAIEQANLEFSTGTAIEAVYMRLAFKDRSKPDATVKMWTKGDTIRDNKSRLMSLFLGSYLRKNYPREKTVFLEELIVHIEGPVDQVVKSRQFKTLTFMSTWNRSMLLQSRTNEISAGLNKRVILDIKELSGIYINDNETALKKAVLYVTPSDVKNSCGIWLKGIRAVNSYEGSGKRSICQTSIDDSIRSFGGPFTDLSGDDGNVETLKFLNYYSFGKSRKSKIMEISNNRGTLDRSDNLTRLTTSKGFITDSSDVKIITTIANHPLISDYLLDDNKLVKEGKGDARIEILWSTDTIIEENTSFLLGLPGSAGFVKSGLITLKSD